MESGFLGFFCGAGIRLGEKAAQSHGREEMFPERELKIETGNVPWKGIETGKAMTELMKEFRDRIKGEEMFPERELKIEIDQSSFENQNDRFVTELGLSTIEAENISKAVRDLTEEKINEQGKNWSKTVREAFANLMTAILIEEVKTLSPMLEKPKILSITQGTHLATQENFDLLPASYALGAYPNVLGFFSKFSQYSTATRYNYRYAAISSKSVSYHQL